MTETQEVTHIAEPLRRFATPLSELHQLKGNPRRGDVDAVARSLDRFGQRTPILYRVERKKKVVYAGNHRLQAAEKLGWNMIAAVDVSDMSAQEAKAFALADNRTSDLGTYDLDLLAEFYGGLSSPEDSLWDDESLAALLGSPLDEEDDKQLAVLPVKSPVYECTRDSAPPISDMIDTTRRDSMLEAIAAADLDEHTRALLEVAAHRHTVFDYEQIAEFYAHADAPVQRLMEQSALIIVDWQSAIEHGFVQLTEQLTDQWTSEYGGVDVD